MTMPNKRVPVAIKVLRGNPGHQKLNTKQPRFSAASCPKTPAHLGKLARDEWNRIAPELFVLGLLTSADVNLLAAYCVTYERWRTCEAKLAASGEMELTLLTTNGNVAWNPLVGMASSACRDLLKLSEQFGFSPLARDKLSYDGRRSADDA